MTKEYPRQKVYELALRGYVEVLDSDEFGPRDELEYGEALDEFAELIGAPRRIGDQPENVRQFWEEVFEQGPDDPRGSNDE